MRSKTGGYHIVTACHIAAGLNIAKFSHKKYWIVNVFVYYCKPVCKTAKICDSTKE